jgi:predicted metalloprotease
MAGAGLGGLGIVGVIVVLLFSVLSGGGGGGGLGIPGLEPLPPSPGAQAGGGISNADDDDMRQFVGFVVDDIQDTWTGIFRSAGRAYQPTTLVLFTGGTVSGCGPASSATGPFYCPRDGKVYLDLDFFRELRSRFGAPGDFAQAYVIAHEFGHHVQNLLGINEEVSRAQQQNPANANPLSVRLELQADCLAGVWAHSAYRENLLEPGDVEEGLAAAAAVGDDRIQASIQGRIDPESWTHGSAEQRQAWFTRGFESGDPNSCDTFSSDV